jgi:peptide-methionine (S)-S-oxide reductase
VAHDPTQLNRQGPDEGTQYRSEIFATSGAQQQAAEAYIAELDKAKAFAGRIVTKVEPLKAFYRAEPYQIRITPRCIPAAPTSPSTTCRKSQI